MPAASPPRQQPAQRARTSDAQLASGAGGFATQHLVVGLALALLVYAVLRSAWLSDDAYITFRTVDNALNGHGLRWNVIERVQTYTHPLWMLLLVATTFVTREFYFTPLALSIGCSLAAALIVAFGFSAQRIAAALAVLALTSSKAFVDYGTSGLETALTYVLVAVFLSLYFRRTHTANTRNALALVAALAILNRPDTLLLVAPAVLHAWFATPARERLRMAVVGLAPLLAWETFSLVYYGFLLPNTAYAKLATGTPRLELLTQGLHYFANSWRIDPLTLPVIAFGLWTAARARATREAAVGLGIVATLLYVVWIGGDFMSGRFLAAPLLVAVILAVRQPASPPGTVVALAGIVGLGLLSPFPPLLARSDYGATLLRALDTHGIADERQFYYPATGLLSAARNSTVPAHRYVRNAMIARRGPDVTVMDTMGMQGFFVGPRIHVIDMFGLCDPLTARLPARRDIPWRPGHFGRVVPEGYVASARAVRSGIEDERLARYDDLLRIVTRGPLLGAVRWKAIVALNLGRYDALIDAERYRFPAPTHPNDHAQ